MPISRRLLGQSWCRLPDFFLTGLAGNPGLKPTEGPSWKRVPRMSHELKGLHDAA
jgi:hypothetical protein